MLFHSFLSALFLVLAVISFVGIVLSFAGPGTVKDNLDNLKYFLKNTFGTNKKERFAIAFLYTGIVVLATVLFYDIDTEQLKSDQYEAKCKSHNGVIENSICYDPLTLEKSKLLKEDAKIDVGVK